MSSLSPSLSLFLLLLLFLSLLFLLPLSPSSSPLPSPPLSRPLLLPHTQVHNKYSAADFDDDLRTVLRRSGCKDEKIVFIMDESNVLESGFLERMNTLLANGEVS